MTGSEPPGHTGGMRADRAHRASVFVEMRRPHPLGRPGVSWTTPQRHDCRASLSHVSVCIHMGSGGWGARREAAVLEAERRRARSCGWLPVAWIMILQPALWAAAENSPSVRPGPRVLVSIRVCFLNRSQRACLSFPFTPNQPSFWIVCGSGRWGIP